MTVFVGQKAQRTLSLTENHVKSRLPADVEITPWAHLMMQVLEQRASIVDSMGTIRNRASLAHPNEELLEQVEALFVIYLARSLIGYLDSKL